MVSLLWWTSICFMTWLRWVSGLRLWRTRSYMRMVQSRRFQKFLKNWNSYTSKKFRVSSSDFLYHLMSVLCVKMIWFLQDCVGDQAEDLSWYGCWSWMLHRPESKSEYSYGPTQFWEAHFFTFLCLVQGKHNNTLLFLWPVLWKRSLKTWRASVCCYG